MAKPRYKYTRNGQPRLYISDHEQRRLVTKVVKSVRQSRYRPRLVICIATGGLFIGPIVARALGIPYAVWMAQGYDDRADSTGVSRRKIVFAKSIVFIDKYGVQRSLPKKLTIRVLLIDDLDDQGRTFHEAVKKLRRRYGTKFDLRTLCLWHKTSSNFFVDFVGQVVERDTKSGQWPWIVQPHEQKVEQIKKALKQKRKSAH